jgi:hypothetical protein
MRRRIVFGIIAVALAACAQVVGVKDLQAPDDSEDDAGQRDSGGVTDSGPVYFDAGAGQDAIVVYPPPLPTDDASVEYWIDGGDQVRSAFFNNDAKYGPTTTVHYGDTNIPNCYDETFHYRTGYDETMRNCIDGLHVEQTSGSRSQTFLGFNATTTLTCQKDVYFTTEPAPTTFVHSCTGSSADNKTQNSSFTTAGTYAFKEDLMMSVGGTDMLVRHFIDPREISGSQTGSNNAEWWFTAQGGLLVKFTRDIQLKYPTGFGEVTYTESLEMNLKQLP